MLDLINNPVFLGGGAALVVFFGILLCHEIGRRMGRWARGHRGEDDLPGVGSLETAVFALPAWGGSASTRSIRSWSTCAPK